MHTNDKVSNEVDPSKKTTRHGLRIVAVAIVAVKVVASGTWYFFPSHHSSTTADVSGGTGGYQFDWAGLPPGCFAFDSPSITCTPALPGVYAIDLNITDSNDLTAGSPYASYAVDSEPTILALWEQPASILMGQSVNFTTSVFGGSDAYTYAWSGLPRGCLGADSPAISCTPSEPGNYRFEVQVTYSNGVSSLSLPSFFTVYMEDVTIAFNMTGTQGGMVRIAFLDSGSTTVNYSLERTHGPPNDLQLPPILFKEDHYHGLQVTYQPPSAKGHTRGDNPSFLNITYSGCTSGNLTLFHDFNSQHVTSYLWFINLTHVFDCIAPDPAPTSPPPNPPSTPPVLTSEGGSPLLGGRETPLWLALQVGGLGGTFQALAVGGYLQARKGAVSRKQTKPPDPR